MATKELLEEIYSALNLADVLADLAPKDMGEAWELACPKCQKRRAFIYKGQGHIICNRRESCKFKTSLWDYIQGREGLTQRATLERLAALAAVPLPDMEPEALRRIEAVKRREGILDAALSFFQSQLPGSAAFTYLTRGRGYSPEEIEGMGLGHYPGWSATAAHLIREGFTDAEVRDAFFQDREAYVVVIPWRKPGGALRGLWGRAASNPEDGRKYLPLTKESTKGAPLNWENAQRERRIYLVEGHLDALRLEANGIKGAAGLGTAAKLSEELVTLIQGSKAETVVVCMDGDDAGQKATEAIIPQILAAGKVCLALRLPSDLKDPDGYIAAKGAAAFREYIKAPPAWWDWLVERILYGKFKDAATIQEESALAEKAVLELAERLSDPVARERILNTAADYLGVSRPALEEKERMIREAQARQSVRDMARARLSEASEAFGQGDDLAGREILEDVTQAIRAKGVSREINVYTMDSLLTDVKEGRPGLKTGFKSLDETLSVSIPQEAITLVAGRPSHGKTSLMLNLLLNIAQAEPDQVFPIFTYEETPKQLAIKLINILGGYSHMGGLSNLSHIEAYLRTGKSAIAQWETAKAKLRALTNPEAPRILIIETTSAATDLVDTIANLSARHKLGGVFIDYIQKIKFNGKADNRTIELKKVSERILEGAKGLHLPIILGAQLGRDREGDKPKGKGNGNGEPAKTKPGRPVRLDNIRECGDIEQDANLVLGLHNSAFEKAEEAGTKVDLSKPVPTTLTLLKNRNGGAVNRYVGLDFHGSINTFKDKGEADEW